MTIRPYAIATALCGSLMAISFLGGCVAYPAGPEAAYEAPGPAYASYPAYGLAPTYAPAYGLAPLVVQPEVGIGFGCCWGGRSWHGGGGHRGGGGWHGGGRHR